jgi:hypothetical protein
MADARAEQIIAAIKTTLTGLTTTGARVQRGQIYNHEETKLPALAITMGADVPVAEYQTDLLDWELAVRIEASANIETDYITQDSLLDQALNQIRKEVHAAVMADHTQGLAFVIDTTPGPASEPLLSGEGAQPIGSLVLEYIIRYRTSRQDISA